jgi:uncharacterized protein (TIGR03083 family)
VDSSRYLECLDEDYSLFRDAAAAVAGDVQVPSCPGWTMDHLVRHLARVYLNKAAVLRTGEWPKEWPPRGLAGEPRLALLARAYRELIAELAVHGPATPAVTWYEPDETAGFWFRRMAQETVIHRVDAEQAAGLAPTHVPDDLATDGIDEVLTCFLAYFSPEAIASSEMAGEWLAGVDGAETIVVTAGAASWTVRPLPSCEVSVQAGVHGQPQARVESAPGPLLRWLWGRASDDAVRVSGDRTWADCLRRMLAATTR